MTDAIDDREHATASQVLADAPEGGVQIVGVVPKVPSQRPVPPGRGVSVSGTVRSNPAGG
jgi:hypothetical protein